MPARHRHFLEFLAAKANMGNFTESRLEDANLQLAYSSCREALADHRTKHLQIILRYILAPSPNLAQSKVLPETKPGIAEGIQDFKKCMAINGDKADRLAKYTGPTSPMIFLKRVRDETRYSI